MTSFIGWGDAWGNSWGSAIDPNAMRGSASFSFTAVLTVNDGEMVAYATMGLSGTATLTLPTPPIHGGNDKKTKKDHKPHRIPSYEDYLKSTEKDDKEYLDKLYKFNEPVIQVIKKEAISIANIEDLYHNAEHNRQKLKQSLIDQGIAYQEAYLEVYYELVKSQEQAKEDDAIAAVIAAML